MKAFTTTFKWFVFTLIGMVFMIAVTGLNSGNTQAQDVLPQPIVSDACIVNGKPMILDSKYMGNDDIMFYITYVRNDGMIVSSYTYTKGNHFGSYEIIQTDCPSLR